MRGDTPMPDRAAATPPAAAAVLDAVGRYYTDKVRRHGATALGVDWDSGLGQRLRFVQLLKIVADWTEPLSLHDVGCGYGALLDHLCDRHPGAPVRYLGSDVSAEMIRRARRRRRPPGLLHPPGFVVAGPEPPAADYSVASGIFNVRLDHPMDEWERHVAATLRALCAASRKGFAVNFMAPEALQARPAAAASLYGPPAQRWIAFSRDVLRREVELLRGYGLPEYTLLVRPPS